MLPEANETIARDFELPLLLPVSLLVPLQLRRPERPIYIRHVAAPRASMPVAAVEEYDQPGLGEKKVR
jgi:hypothetical protein